MATDRAARKRTGQTPSPLLRKRGRTSGDRPRSPVAADRSAVSRKVSPAKSRAVALLRAVNVGGRTVTMARLVALFGALGYERIETFLASGNVVFDLPSGSSPAEHERRIEAALSDALGYRVPVFVRTLDEIALIARFEPFDAVATQSAGTFSVAFLSSPPDPAGVARVAALGTDVDRLHVHGREIYWISRVRQNESRINNVTLERALGRPATMRGISTVRRLTAKYLNRGAGDGG